MAEAVRAAERWLLKRYAFCIGPISGDGVPSLRTVPSRRRQYPFGATTARTESLAPRDVMMKDLVMVFSCSVLMLCRCGKGGYMLYIHSASEI